MDRIPTNDNNIEAHKAIHELMCMVFKSMTDRLSGSKIKHGAGFDSAEIKPQPQPLEVPSKSSYPPREEGDEVSEAVSEYLK
jgi:hypothetical protein